MAEEKCDKYSFVGDKAAMQQRRNRKFHATLASICAEKTLALLKSADTRRIHEKTCDGPKLERSFR